MKLALLGFGCCLLQTFVQHTCKLLHVAMASNSQGIQHLLAAEKKAAELVAEARKRKVRTLKQAKEEAQAEIEQYRAECEQKFRDELKTHGGLDNFQKQINADTVSRMDTMGKNVEGNKDQVIERILTLVYDIKPELHQNFRA